MSGFFSHLGIRLGFAAVAGGLLCSWFLFLFLFPKFPEIAVVRETASGAELIFPKIFLFTLPFAATLFALVNTLLAAAVWQWLPRISYLVLGLAAALGLLENLALIMLFTMNK